MAFVQCPNCRHRFFTADGTIEISPRQKEILRAIPDVARDSRTRTASTAAIAVKLGWSERTVRYELAHLEHMKEVQRLNKRCGWRLFERPVMMAA